MNRNVNKPYIYGFTDSEDLSHFRPPLLTDLVGQRADDDAQVGQGAVDGRHLFEAFTLRLTLQHSLAASQVHQAQSGCTHKIYKIRLLRDHICRKCSCL